MVSAADARRDPTSVRQPVRTGRRLSICYAAPGQNLLPTAGPSRNVLSLAESLSQWADVTVAFRDVIEPVDASAYRVISIDPGSTIAVNSKDDTATRGFHPLRHVAYCHTLRSFARQHAHSFDVILEKGWRLSGFLSAAFRRHGVPAALVENTVSLWLDPVNDLRSGGKYLLHRAAVAVTNHCSRRLETIIAETDGLKQMIVSHRGVSPDRIEVVELGVDHRLFHPMGQSSARASLGIGQDALVLLYAGGIDEFHDLGPVIEAIGLARRAAELHVVGDGEHRARAEERAEAAGIKSRFHGRVPHRAVPQYIAAADLCLAPYRTTAFHDGLVTFATLKIPEYMACARPVVSVPSPAIHRLVGDGLNGFLLPNNVSSWTAFLRALPSREDLAALGRAAADAVASISWETTARRYFDICERLTERGTRPPNDVIS